MHRDAKCKNDGDSGSSSFMDLHSSIARQKSRVGLLRFSLPGQVRSIRMECPLYSPVKHVVEIRC